LKISVVIPTVGRPELERAIRSVIRQTEAVHEIIVAADTERQLTLPPDDRIQVVRVGPGAGGNVGRQRGVEIASGDVIGLLDDDDEWLPTKVATLRRMIPGSDENWIATSRVVLKRADGSELVQPSFPIKPGQDLREYMFAKRSPRSGHGFIQASTLLFPRRFALEVPFDQSLRFHQDVSWLTSVSKLHPNVRVIQAWEPLAGYYATEGSVSKQIAPEGSIEWAQQHLGDDRRLLGDFILTQSLGFARRTGSVRSMIRTARMGLRVGRPGLAAIIYAAGATLKQATAAVGARGPR
jgi:glycosyltransferase involved in cell wall biosynthesis